MRHRPRAGRLLTLTVLLLTSTVATVTTAPAPAAASTTVTPMVASFGAHTCELVPDGTVRCWGANHRGQLGDGTTTSSATRVTVVLPGGAPLQHVVAITVGSDHTCALLGADPSLDGSPSSVRCWGSNHRGQLGDGTTTNRLNPVTVLADGTRGSADETPLIAVAAVSAGGQHTCALLTNQQVRCWGANDSGQLGDGIENFVANPHPATVRLPDTTDPLTGVTGIASGGKHTCAVLADNSAVCWGANNFGQLGDGTTTNRLNPVTVLANIAGERPLTAVAAVSAGFDFTCATVTDAGTTTGRCWGDNSVGQLGDGTTTQRSTPVTVLATDGAPLEMSAISAGSGHTCALADDGAVLCWGANNFGQLGNGTRTTTSPIPPNSTPTPVHLTGTSGATLTDITSIAPGNQHTCALAADSSGTTARRCWGRNDVGQLGAGTITDLELNPVSVLLNFPDRAGILALDSPSCTATFSTVDGPFAELTTPSAFDVEVTFDRTALVTWVTALTASGTGGPLETLWGIDPAEDLRLVETALAVRPVSAAAAGGVTGTSGAVVPTVAVAGTEMRDLTRTLFGPEATAFNLAVDETVTTRYLRGISSGTIDDYPTRFTNLFRSSPDDRSFAETQLTTPLDDWGLAPVDTATPFQPEVVLSLRLATGGLTADEQMVVVLPCGGPATVASTPPVTPPATPPAATPDEPEDPDADEPADDAPAPRAVTCSSVSVSVMSCGLTGGEPFETVSWQAAFNPVFASGTLQLDENGAGTLTFDIPDEANGRPVLVTIDGWDVSTITVASVPIPDSIPAGEGPPPALFSMWLLIGAGFLAAMRFVRRSRSTRPV